jgi:uncharacterized protein (DUF1697 family)
MRAQVMHVAFFRSMNLGHPGSPTATEFVAAFSSADRARTFQTSGTIVFQADEPPSTVKAARDELLKGGYEHEVVARSLIEVTEIVEQMPLIAAGSDVYRLMVTFVDDPQPTAPVGFPFRTGSRPHGPSTPSNA